jgi:hypothetical protein
VVGWVVGQTVCPLVDWMVVTEHATRFRTTTTHQHIPPIPQPDRQELESLVPTPVTLYSFFSPADWELPAPTKALSSATAGATARQQTPQPTTPSPPPPAPSAANPTPPSSSGGSKQQQRRGSGTPPPPLKAAAAAAGGDGKRGAAVAAAHALVAQQSLGRFNVALELIRRGQE